MVTLEIVCCAAADSGWSFAERWAHLVAAHPEVIPPELSEVLESLVNDIRGLLLEDGNG